MSAINFALNPFLEVIGLGLGPRNNGLTLYILVVDDDSAVVKPVMQDGFIIMFKKIEAAPMVLQLAAPDVVTLGPPPDKEAVLVNITKTIHLVQSEDVDHTASILNFLNVFFDLIQAVGLLLPVEYERPLVKFANHLTLSKEYGGFFKNDAERLHTLNGILWMIGALVAKAQLYP